MAAKKDYASARERFLDGDFQWVCVRNADVYIHQRPKDYTSLKETMTWKLGPSSGTFQCLIYGMSILVTFRDNILHDELAAGGGEVILDASDLQDAEYIVFRDIRQVMAYILARYW
jgi:hypothetical protein